MNSKLPDGATLDIRPAQPDDAGTVMTMLLELADHEDSRSAVDLDEDQLRRLLGRDDVIVLLAEINGDAVGYVSAARQVKFWTGGEILALDDLYVRERHRDRRVGEQLMHDLARRTAEHTRIIRWEIGPDNDAGHRFYRRIGATIRTKSIATWRAKESAEGQPVSGTR